MQATIPKKLYITALVILAMLGFATVLTVVVISIHDSLVFRTLPHDYQSSISRLDAGWHYLSLSDSERKSILQMHQQWEKEGRVPWGGGDEFVDPVQQRSRVLEYFAEFVPRWGGATFQFHPIRSILLSILSLVPAVLLITLWRWYHWLLG